MTALLLYAALAGWFVYAIRRESRYVARLRPDTVLTLTADTAKFTEAMSAVSDALTAYGMSMREVSERAADAHRRWREESWSLDEFTRGPEQSDFDAGAGMTLDELLGQIDRLTEEPT